MCAEGEWKGAKDGGVDPFKDLRASYEKMVDEKQSMQPAKPKEIGQEMDKSRKMKAKNIINVVRTTNRSPKN